MAPKALRSPLRPNTYQPPQGRQDGTKKHSNGWRQPPSRPCPDHPRIAKSDSWTPLGHVATELIRRAANAKS
eukprot:3953451-Pyramimonas_sp.AAC.1